jgi:hypothetical protein
VTAAWTSFTDRMVRAAKLEVAVYEEVEADRGATLQAAMVVVLGSLAAGVGSVGRLGFLGFIVVVVVALGAWSFYAWITYFLGTTILKGEQTKTEWGELARTLGFASAPRLLLALNVIPGLAGLVSTVVALWLLATTVVALRAALDMTTARAIVVAVVGWIAQAWLTALLIALQQSG